MRKKFFAGFFSLAMLFSGVSAFTQEWGFGLETSFGVLSGDGFFSTYSFSIQGINDYGFGWSLDYIKGLDVDEWVDGVHHQSSGILVNSGLLGSAFWGFKISKYFIPYVGGGIGLKFNGDADVGFGWKVDAGIISWPIDRLYVKAGAMYDSIREDLGITVGVGLKFAKNITPPAPRSTPSPISTPLAPKVNPRRYPTLTPEELQKVELAYAETVRDIEWQGKRLYIRNTQERAVFIQQYQGTPNTTVTKPLRKEAFGSATQKYYSSYNTSEKDIVTLARNEPDVFRKVRMIHDWVSDIFSYDYDLLWWMENISGQNAVFTLGELVQRKRGVCLEYAIVFFNLMDAAGIDTYLISDHSEPGIGHAYNMVVIDGTGYIIDTTWDSKNTYNQGRVTKYQPPCDTKYFMLGISESYKARGW